MCEAIETEFYQNIIRCFGNVSDIVVTEIETENACAAGNNFVSTVLRVKVKGFIKTSNDEYSTSLIVKILSRTPMAKFLNFDIIFRNEEVAYNKIVPALTKHSKHKLAVPRCFYASESMVVLEDLSLLNYKAKIKGHRFTVQQCEQVLKELSIIHAASLKLQCDEPKTAELIRLSQKNFLKPDANDNYFKIFINSAKVNLKIFEQLGNRDENYENIVAILKNLHENLIPLMEETFMKEDRDIGVFIHGDCWGNNILFKDEKVCLLDLQVMHYSSVAADLNYFLYSNTDIALRKSHKKELQSKYLQYLIFYCKENEVKEEIIVKLNQEWLDREISEFLYFGFLIASIFIPVFHADLEEIERKVGEEMLDSEKTFNEMREDFKKMHIENILEYIENLKDR